MFWEPASDAPGWLVRCLSEFADRGVNLTRIESRPLKQGLGSYMFFLDLEGRDSDPRVVHREDGSWLFDGMVALDEVKQALRIAHLPGEDADFHTLGGYLMARLNRVPMVADRVIAGSFRFEVVEMDGRRVDRVLVAPAATTEL